MNRPNFRGILNTFRKWLEEIFQRAAGDPYNQDDWTDLLTKEELEWWDAGEFLNEFDQRSK